ncbi:hypothetical protein KC717_02175 [Candidatus Dojkabacteria bacterium]|uniref:Polysaccharide deacetylase n=1 Tax=Candidatus Dojkabacteria bacterium TaxID=2099670 RepID=A0A955RK24_9BACT|nr:hypothetical protein [Candidatus Dojkabacteria bacterium]
MQWNPKKTFSMAELKRIYTKALDSNFEFINCADIYTKNNGYYIALRHDIDLSLIAAIEVAKLENELGIQATYCFMVQSNFYNLFSSEGRKALQIISSYGHNLALHHHTMSARNLQIDLKKVEKNVIIDFDVIDKYYPGKFEKIVSFHNPPKNLIGAEFDSFLSTYSPHFLKNNIKYLSDSNRYWREGDVIEWIQKAPDIHKYHILIHPELWFYKDGEMKDAMNDLVEHQISYTWGLLKQDDLNL